MNSWPREQQAFGCWSWEADLRIWLLGFGIRRWLVSMNREVSVSQVPRRQACPSGHIARTPRPMHLTPLFFVKISLKPVSAALPPLLADNADKAPIPEIWLFVGCRCTEHLVGLKDKDGSLEFWR